MRKLGKELPLKLLNNKELLNNKSGLILIGKVVAPHGVSGVLKVRSFTDSLSTYDFFTDFLLEAPDCSNIVHMKSFWIKPYKQGVRICFKGIKDRNQAKSFVGFHLYVKKTDLPMLEKDTYFWSDLINMSVKSTSGNDIGCLCSIIRTGSNDVYVVKKIEYGVETECLIPAIKSVVLDVDLVNNKLLVDLPEGLE